MTYRGSRLAFRVGMALVGAADCMHPGADVPYVQTPNEVVIEMLRLARVAGSDIVYDLGSGDGRLVIAAARDFGARGVGIEIDPRLVAQSAESARRAGVGERVTFREGDLSGRSGSRPGIARLRSISGSCRDPEGGSFPILRFKRRRARSGCRRGRRSPRESTRWCRPSHGRRLCRCPGAQ